MGVLGLNNIRQRISFFNASLKWSWTWKSVPVGSWVKGGRCFKDKNYRLAVLHYKKGLERYPNHKASEAARIDLAYCHYRLNEINEALAVLSYCIKQRSRNRDIYTLASRLYMCLGHPNEASKCLDSYLQIKPDDVLALSALMHVQLSSVKCSLSEIQATKAMLLRGKARLKRFDYNLSFVETALAHYEICYGDDEKAQRIMSRVLATGSAPFEAVLLHAEILLDKGLCVQARGNLGRAISVLPEDPRPLVLLARSYLIKGVDYNPNWALDIAHAACRLSLWENALCLSVYSLALLENNEESKAEIFIERLKNTSSFAQLDLSRITVPFIDREETKVSNG